MAQARNIFDPVLLGKAKKIFEVFTQQHNSSEDYYPREKYPHLVFAGLDALADHPEVDKIIEADLFHRFSQDFSRKALQFVESASEEEIRTGDRTRHFLSLHALVPYLFKVGECQGLASLLIIKFMKINVPELQCVSLEEITKNGVYTHQYLTLLDENRNEYVFDPFFKIHCPADEYFKNKKVLNYFRKTTGILNWPSEDLPFSCKYYPLSLYQPRIDEFFSDIQFFTEKVSSQAELRWIQDMNTFRDASQKERMERFIPDWIQKIGMVFKNNTLVSQSEIDFGLSQFKQKLEKRGLLSRPYVSDLDRFLQEIRSKNEGGRFNIFLKCVAEKNWGAAVRTACTSLNCGVMLIGIMQKYPKLFSLADLIIELNKDTKTAFHIAAAKGNVALFNIVKEILIQNQKSLAVLNGDGKTAQQVLDEFLSQAKDQNQAGASSTPLVSISQQVSTLYGGSSAQNADGLSEVTSRMTKLGLS